MIQIRSIFVQKNLDKNCETSTFRCYQAGFLNHWYFAISFLEVQLPEWLMFCTKNFDFCPSKKSEADSFLAQRLFGICTKSWQQQLVAKIWGPHATESYFFAFHLWCLICYLSFFGAWQCARHDAVQTHHLLVLREDVETRTHPELVSSPEMPRLDAMRQGSESPKRHNGGTLALAFQRLPHWAYLWLAGHSLSSFELIVGFYMYLDVPGS